MIQLCLDIFAKNYGDIKLSNMVPELSLSNGTHFKNFLKMLQVN